LHEAKICGSQWLETEKASKVYPMEYQVKLEIKLLSFIRKTLHEKLQGIVNSNGNWTFNQAEITMAHPVCKNFVAQERCKNEGEIMPYPKAATAWKYLKQRFLQEEAMHTSSLYEEIQTLKMDTSLSPLQSFLGLWSLGMTICLELANVSNGQEKISANQFVVNICKAVLETADDYGKLQVQQIRKEMSKCSDDNKKFV
jgi:hypothetical protein